MFSPIWEWGSCPRRLLRPVDLYPELCAVFHVCDPQTTSHMFFDDAFCHIQTDSRAATRFPGGEIKIKDISDRVVRYPPGIVRYGDNRLLILRERLYCQPGICRLSLPEGVPRIGQDNEKHLDKSLRIALRP